LTYPLGCGTEDEAWQYGFCQGDWVLFAVGNMGYRLLLADDDPGFREVVREVCAPFFEIVEAETGDEALDLVATRPDLALCDYHMPGRSGLEALAALKALDVRTPAILMTSDTRWDLNAEVRRSRIDTWLAKPFTRRELLRAFATAIESAYDDSRLSQRLLAH
jgi:two-component system, response regulator PdtaR